MARVEGAEATVIRSEAKAAVISPARGVNSGRRLGLVVGQQRQMAGSRQRQLVGRMAVARRGAQGRQVMMYGGKNRRGGRAAATVGGVDAAII